jgi:hypothetical protein
MIFVLSTVYVLYPTYLFAYVEQILHPGMKLTRSWGMIILIFCCTRFASILLRILASLLIRKIGIEFSFFVVSFLDFEISAILALQNGFCHFPILSVSWKSLRGIHISYVKSGRIQQCIHQV